MFTSKTDRFSSYEEDQIDVSEEESDASRDSGSDSDWETIDDDARHPLDKRNPSDDGGFSEVLEEEGTFASLRAAFEALTNEISSNCKTESANSTIQEDTQMGWILVWGRMGHIMVLMLVRCMSCHFKQCFL
ncbi:Anaphase-promoting complex subunit 5 [Psidium guajava]|nr:Anaphase-promoting complex subunit 5 [Psidium guajava]